MSDEKPIYCGGCHTHWPSFKAWHDHNCQHKLSFSEQQIRTHGAKKARTEERVKLIIEERDQLQEENARMKAVVDAARAGSHLLNNIKFDLDCSVYTLTDDEFETTFYVRDLLDLALKALDDAEERSV